MKTKITDDSRRLDLGWANLCVAQLR